MIEFFPSREVVVMVGHFTVRWYGLMYVIALWVGWYLTPRIGRTLALSRQQWSELVLWVMVGATVGGRLGYVALYEPGYYWSHLSEIWLLQYGGMSAHGGFIGVAVAVWAVAKKLRVDWLALADVVVVPVALGLALGRVGNFMNQELYPGYWALGVAAADAVLGWTCWYVLYKKPVWAAGVVTGVFLVGYGLIRLLNELVRLDEWWHVSIFTYGQVLTIPIVLIGLFLLQRYFSPRG